MSKLEVRKVLILGEITDIIENVKKIGEVLPKYEQT